MFHEIDQDRIDKLRGMDITFVTTAANDDEGRALLKALGFPFKAAADEPAKVAKKKRPAMSGKKKK
jgi:large subunit ribosomal protein L5